MNPGTHNNIEGLTEDEALDLFFRLRDRFGWSGTVMVRQDVVDAVRGAASGDARLTFERENELVEAVMGGYTYRKLQDRFAELGNELLSDAARGAIAGDTDL